jgi:Tfp pilus assembly protein PilO
MLIAAGATFLVLVLWYVALWAPRSRAISEARERTEVAEQQQDNLRVQIARLKAAQRDEPAKRAQAESLRAAVPDEPNLGQFILDTNDAATRAGIEFLSIAPNPPAAGTATAPAAIELNMSLSGGYFQVLDFLNRLSTMPRLVVIREVTLGGRADTGRLTVSLTAQMFTTGGGGAAAPSPPAGDGATTTTSSTSTTVAGT